MTFSPPMLPALPPKSAVGFNADVDTGPAALRSSRHSQSTKDRQSFLDTLNHVSRRQECSPRKATCAKIRAEGSAGPAKEPADPGSTGSTANDSPNLGAEIEAAAPVRVSPVFDLSQAFGMIQKRFFDFSMAGNASFSNETQSEILDASSSVLPKELMGYVQPEGQGSLIDWLVGIGPFEQLLDNISPEASDRYAVEQLAAQLSINRGSGGVLGSQTEFIGLWPWRASSPEVTLNNSAASMWVNGDTLLGAPSHMQQIVAAASGLNADAIGAAGQNAPLYLETLQLNEALSAKVTIPSLSAESDLSETTKLAENADIGGAGKNAPVTLMATADPNSQTFLETSSRQLTEKSPFFKMTADIKTAAEQGASPNFVAEGVPSKTADAEFSLKNPVLKAESLPIAELGGKTAQAEGDTKDGGFMFAQDQMPEHLKAPESVTRSLEGAQRGLTSQAMDQIVQKAVLLLNNDQHEVRIELKPEFLGHIRMQIVTENQQVAIKIVAEFPFVKEMLENNLHQLRAVLQDQGLDIEELEVSVAHDSHAEGDTHQAAEVAKFQAVSSGSGIDEGSPEQPDQSPSQGNSPMAETGIDYFA